MNELELANDKVLLYPNPATSVVTIESAEEYHTVSVLDQLGRMVIQRKVNNLRTLDISALQSGIYFVRLESYDKPRIAKLIKH